MAVITRIDGIPLFSSIREALRWNRFNSIKGGYHIHYWEGRKGYMGGNNHLELAKRRSVKIDPKLATQQQASRLLRKRKPTQTVEPIRPERPIRREQRVQPQEPRIRQQPVRPTTRRTTSGGGSGY